MNRLWQLKRALPLTLMHAFPYRNRHGRGRVLRIIHDLRSYPVVGLKALVVSTSYALSGVWP